MSYWYKGGIYKITNKNDGSFYIGSTIEFSRRRTKHFSELRRGVHDNKHLQRIYNKYGEDNLEFSIMAVYPVGNRDLLFEIEQRVINTLAPRLNGAKVVAKPAPPNKPVGKYDTTGKFVTAYPSIKEAAIDSGVHSNSIQDVIAGRSYLSANHFWKLIDDDGNYDVLPSTYLEGWRKSQSYKRITSFKVLQLSISGDVIREWGSLSEVVTELKIDRHYLRKHLSNPKLAPTCCGYKFVEIKDSSGL